MRHRRRSCVWTSCRCAAKARSRAKSTDPTPVTHRASHHQSEAYAREGVEIDVSTLAGWVGSCVATLDPILEAIRRHVFAADRLHVDDTTVPVLAKLKTVTGRLWAYVRDDQPFGGKAPPAAFFYYSRSRAGDYPRAHLSGWSGIMQAD